MMDNTIFVTIGYTNSNIPRMNKVALRYNTGESIVKIAKDLRNKAAKEDHIKNPSRLTWAIFEKVNDKTPVITSENWYETTITEITLYNLSKDLQFDGLVNGWKE
jgi:hypothetical protein